MKKTHLLIIIVLSILVGFFAYPYFHPKTAPDSDIEKAGSEVDTSSVTSEENVELDPISKVSTISPPSVNSANGNDLSVAQDNSSNVNQNVADIDSGSSSHNESVSDEYGNPDIVPTVIPSDRMDFSFYTLRNTKETFPVSETDPRISYLSGRYRGSVDGYAVELEINSNASSLQFGDRVTYASANTDYFYNVNNNGNIVLIENQEAKFFVNFKEWPILNVNEGYSGQFQLTRVK